MQINLSNPIAVKRVANYVITIFTTLLLILIGIISMWYHMATQEELNRTQTTVSVSLNNYGSQIHNEIAHVISDLKILAATLPIPNPQDPPEVQKHYLKDLSQGYLGFLNSRKNFNQIRYLDIRGNEIARVHKTPDGKSALVETENLQNKFTRYYFHEIFRLNEGEVYISRLDLNIERDQIEEPHKSMLRFGMLTYSNSANGIREPNGMIIINYLADNILNFIQHMSHEYFETPYQSNIQMIDAQGFWLLGPEEKRFGFMLNQPTNTLINEQPALWKAMINNKQGSFEQDDVITFYHFIPVTQIQASNLSQYSGNHTLQADNAIGQEYGWYLLTQIPKTRFGEMVEAKMVAKWPFFSALIVVMFLVSVLLAIVLLKYQKRHKQMQYLAYYDPLTSAMTRSAWMNLIRPKLLDWIHDKSNFAVAYVDLDGFKQTNDTYGHNVGDDVLKITAKRLLQIVRKGDYVIRLGGDEFIIVLSDAKLENQPSVDFLKEKLSLPFSEPMVFSNFTIQQKVSIGVAHFPEDGKDIDSLLRTADVRMYEVKADQKNL